MATDNRPLELQTATLHTRWTPLLQSHILRMSMDRREQTQIMFRQTHPVRDANWEPQGHIRRSQDFSRDCKHWKRQQNKTTHERESRQISEILKLKQGQQLCVRKGLRYTFTILLLERQGSAFMHPLFFCNVYKFVAGTSMS